MTEETKEKKKTCWLAKLSAFCLVGVLFIVIPAMCNKHLSGTFMDLLLMMVPALLVLSLISAIASLVRILRKPSQLRGAKTAMIVMVIALCLLIVFVVLPRVPIHHYPASPVICATNLKGLGTSVMIYAADYDDVVHDGIDWCDVLIMEVDGDPEIFRCKDSGAVHGESSYALNKNALGKKLSELPGDMVLIFETSLGRKDTERTEKVRDRPLFSKYPETSGLSGNEKVYLGRWNQVGGAEDLTVDNHEGRGCKVLFGDGHVEFVKTEDIGKLRWTAE